MTVARCQPGTQWPRCWQLRMQTQTAGPRTRPQRTWSRRRLTSWAPPPAQPPPPFAAPPNSGDGGPCLWGRLTFGDAVDDEWLAVWLLRGLTAALPPGTAARAWDEDGEFVLIEAAEALPKWVRPEAVADRVWWAGGALHLVPPPAPPGAAP